MATLQYQIQTLNRVFDLSKFGNVAQFLILASGVFQFYLIYGWLQVGQSLLVFVVWPMIF